MVFTVLCLPEVDTFLCVCRGGCVCMFLFGSSTFLDTGLESLKETLPPYYLIVVKEEIWSNIKRWTYLFLLAVVYFGYFSSKELMTQGISVTETIGIRCVFRLPVLKKMGCRPLSKQDTPWTMGTIRRRRTYVVQGVTFSVFLFRSQWQLPLLLT